MSKPPSLNKLLKKKGRFPAATEKRDGPAALESLQLRMLRIQQGIYHRKRRAILVFEGFDAAGKGGAIARLTEKLDPRGVRAHPIGPPEGDEQGKHYLYRFWADLPPPGAIAVFDRSWYGRVLVERVEGLTPAKRWKEAYREINEFERMLVDDGIDLVKVFLAISADEQRARFKARIEDPYKQWKITEADFGARAHWRDYVKATDDAFAETHTHRAPWHLVPANDKHFARAEVLRVVTDELARHGEWMETRAEESRRGKELRAELRKLSKI